MWTGRLRGVLFWGLLNREFVVAYFAVDSILITPPTATSKSSAN